LNCFKISFVPGSITSIQFGETCMTGCGAHSLLSNGYWGNVAGAWLTVHQYQVPKFRKPWSYTSSKRRSPILDCNADHLPLHPSNYVYRMISGTSRECD
jgi:hypothetical protein